MKFSIGRLARRLRDRMLDRDEEAQGLVEYGLILGLIAVVAIASLHLTGTNVNQLLQKVGHHLGTVS